LCVCVLTPLSTIFQLYHSLEIHNVFSILILLVKQFGFCIANLLNKGKKQRKFKEGGENVFCVHYHIFIEMAFVHLKLNTCNWLLIFVCVCFNATFNNISAISQFSGGRSRSTRREPPKIIWILCETNHQTTASTSFNLQRKAK
jgi:hypothetical protein